jgi:hypothetical protein
LIGRNGTEGRTERMQGWVEFEKCAERTNEAVSGQIIIVRLDRLALLKD